MSEHRTGQPDRSPLSLVPERDETAAATAEELLRRFLQCRKRTLALVAPLEPEDYGLQGMADASPPKWHLAHTSWFFDTFVLKPFQKGYRPFHQDFEYLFNSYYLGIGRTFPRKDRGMLSRPTLPKVLAYRSFIDDAVAELLTVGSGEDEVIARVLLGIHHECQHQELIVTDIKYSLFQNPLHPEFMIDEAKQKARQKALQEVRPLTMSMPAKKPGASSGRSGPEWLEFAAGFASIGRDAPPDTFARAADLGRFAFDNESPRHQIHRPAFALSRRPVTNGEFAEFIADDGYRRPEFWLSEGFHFCGEHRIIAPLYWQAGWNFPGDGNRLFQSPHMMIRQKELHQAAMATWERYGLWGDEPLDMAAPVSHISYYEADAYARWKGARLPTELEWESAVGNQPVAGNLMPDNLGSDDDQTAQLAEPRASSLSLAERLPQAFGDVWEWTQSSYSPYPGFRTAEGSLGEYNGKFMVNQYVLKGGSSYTPASHIRASYRNFFHASARWQNTGLRLAKDLP